MFLYMFLSGQVNLRIKLLEILDTLLTGNCFLGTFSRASIGLGSLTTARQSDSMSNPAIAADITKTTDVLLNLASKRAFNGIVTLKDRGDAADFLIRQITGALILINSCLVTKITSSLIPNSKKVSQ